MKIIFKKIKKKTQLIEAIEFIHKNNFSTNSTPQKISKSFDGRTLGLVVKNNQEIIASIFYFYQPKIKVGKKLFNVVSFGTLFVAPNYRGQGLVKKIIQYTKKNFKNYLITTYTPISKTQKTLKTLNFVYMKNYRYLIFPYFFHLNQNKKKISVFNKLEINKKNIIYSDLEQYRKYDIELWQYKFRSESVIFGAISRNHQINLKLFQIKFKSKRILWVNNEKIFAKFSKNIATYFKNLFNFKFITFDTSINKMPFFCLSLSNQFMVYPPKNIRVCTKGSEFFSNCI